MKISKKTENIFVVKMNEFKYLGGFSGNEGKMATYARQHSSINDSP